MTIPHINHHWSLVQPWLLEVEFVRQNITFSSALLWYLTLSKSLTNMVSLSDIVNRDDRVSWKGFFGQ